MKKQGKPKLTNCTKDGVCAARSHTQTVVLVFAYFLCRGFSSTQKLVLCVCVWNERFIFFINYYYFYYWWYRSCIDYRFLFYFIFDKKSLLSCQAWHRRHQSRREWEWVEWTSRVCESWVKLQVSKSKWESECQVCAFSSIELELGGLRCGVAFCLRAPSHSRYDWRKKKLDLPCGCWVISPLAPSRQVTVGPSSPHHHIPRVRCIAVIALRDIGTVKLETVVRYHPCLSHRLPSLSLSLSLSDHRHSACVTT